MFPKKSGIYKITTVHNKQFYIGSALSLSKRMKDHRNNLKKGVFHNDYIQNVYNKYGKEDFRVELLKVHDRIFRLNSEDHRRLLEEEELFIKDLDPTYNVIRTPTSQINNPCTSKKVYQYDLEGSFIGEWASQREVARILGIQPENGLKSSDKSRSSGGFQWSYVKKDKLPKYKPNQGCKMNRKISTYDISGKKLNTYLSMSDCIKQLFPEEPFKGVFQSVFKAVRSTKVWRGYRYFFGEKEFIDNTINRTHKKGYIICQYDLSMNLIKLWENTEKAHKTLGLSSVSDNIKGKTKQCGGFIWKKL